MKLIYSAVLPAVALAGHLDDSDKQQEAYTRVEEAAELIHWITERRIVPELVSHDELEGEEVKEGEEFAGNYRMERPHVNFWLDFGNKRLLSFRQHTNKYQSVRNMLSSSSRAYDAKKYGGAEYEESETERHDTYNFYRTHNLERQTRPTRNSLLRRIASLENMIQYKQNGLAQGVSHQRKPFGAYFDYGCHCFPGSFMDPRHSPHAAPVDEIDRACREHSWAYDCAKQDFGQDCRGKYQAYSWEGRIASDGFTPEIRCIDTEETNPCAWAICEADKHLAERLRDLVTDYDPSKQVALDDEFQQFQRQSICEVTQMHDGSRKTDHNNDQVLYLAQPEEEQTETATVATAGSPANVDSGSSSDPGNEPNIQQFGDFVGSPSDSEESPLTGNMSPTLTGGRHISTGDPEDQINFTSVNRQPKDQYEEGVSEIPDWDTVPVWERASYADSGYPVPEWWLLPKSPSESEASAPWDGGLQFGDFDDGSDLFPNFASEEPAVASTAQPNYDHTVATSPADIVEFQEELDNVTEHIPDEVLEHSPMMQGDDASDWEDGANPSEIEYLNAADGEKAGGSPAGEESNNGESEAPVITLKSAITYSVKQCCGQYPTRYKYSSKKMGCCKDNGIEKLYSPHHSKCCVVKTARGSMGETYASYLATNTVGC